MKKFYHTGFDSFDSPQIKAFGPDSNPELEGFSWGPFIDFDSAKKDFEYHVKMAISNHRCLLAAVKTLKMKTGDRQ